MEPEETAPAAPVEGETVLGDDEVPAPDPPKVRPARQPEKPREADHDLAEPDVPGEEAAPTTRSLARNHPIWFKWAVFFDAVVTATAVLSTLALLGYTAYKTLLQ